MIGKLAEKYGIPAEKGGDDFEAEDEAGEEYPETISSVSAPWREFPAVAALSDFLKAHREQGIQVVRQGNKPVLHFNPPLDPNDEKRIVVADQAMALYFEAARDIEFLLTRNLIPMDEHPGY